MAYLDAAVVERIVQTVPNRVYVLIKRIDCFRAEIDEIVGVYFDLEDASLEALRAVNLTEARLTKYYSPHDRFERRNGTYEISWIDNYNFFKHPTPRYIIQEWSPNLSPKHRLGTRHLDWMNWLRRKIAEERPSCCAVDTWLKDWQLALQNGETPLELSKSFQTKEDEWYEICGDREEWVAMYGTREYGWGAAVLPKPEFA